MSDEEAAIPEDKQQEGTVSVDPLTQAIEDIVNLKARVAELEKHTHSNHSIGLDAVNEIAMAAVHKINDHLRHITPTSAS